MYILTLPEHFQKLKDISEDVANYIDSEAYIADFGPDDYTPKSLLVNCYDVIVGELEDMGITTDLQYQGDLFLCGYLYLVRKYMDDLKLLLTENICDRIETCLNDVEPDINFFKTIYEIINSDKYEHKEIIYIIDSLYTDDKFKDYIKEEIRAFRELKQDNYTYDPEKASAYLAKTKKLRELANKYSYVIINTLHLDVNMSVINKLLRDYDMDKISPSTIGIYSVIDTDQIPPELYNYAKQQMQIHHERSLHHIEYWIDPKKNPKPTPTVENLVLLVAHHVEIGTTPKEFDEEVENMIEKGRSIFNQSQIDLIEQMKKAVLPVMEQTK